MDPSVPRQIDDGLMTGFLMKGSCRPSLLVLALFFAVLSAGISAPDKKTSKISPTFVRDSKAQVARGGEVVIPLVAIPSYGNVETFEIQGQPAHGSLSDLKNTSDHTASVVYHHDASKAPLEDEFSFRAKAPGQSLSAPAKVYIRIIPPPPLLVFEPRELDFGKVPLSEKRVTNVVVSNQGGGRATGRLLFPKGFSSPAGGGYQLAEGDRVSIEVEFSPMEAKSYEDDVKCIPVTEKGPLVVRGTGLPRFEVTPVAEATWSVRNLSGNPIRISFHPTGETGGWALPPESLLPPDSQKAFTLLQEEEEGTQNGSSPSAKVRITDGLTENLLELPPRRRFVPLTLQAVTPPTLGNLSPSVGVTLSFCLVNRSDVPKQAFWKITSPLGGGMSDSMRVELNSGESREIQYLWTPSLPGEGQVRLAVEEGSKTRHELFWKAVVSGRVAAAPVVREARNQKMMPPTGEDQGGGMAISPEAPVRESPLPPVDEANVEITTPWFGKPEVVVRWRVKPGMDGRIRFQECLLVPEEAQKRAPDTSALNLSSMRMMFRDLKTRTMKDHGTGEAAVITGLQPGWHLIILSIQSDAGEARARSQLNVRVPSAPSLWARVRMPLGIGAILLLLLFLRRIRNRGF